MQNKMVRFILDKDSRAHIGQKELNNVGFLNVKDSLSPKVKSCVQNNL